MRSTWRSPRCCIDLAAAFNRRGKNGILVLCQGFCGLDPTGQAFALCVRKYRSLSNIHVASDLAQADAECVSSFNLHPNFVRDLSAHTARRSYRRLLFCTFKSFSCTVYD